MDIEKSGITKSANYVSYFRLLPEQDKLMSIKPALVQLAADIVSAGSTATSAYMSDNNIAGGGAVSVSGPLVAAAGQQGAIAVKRMSAVDALSEQFWAGSEYIHKAGNKATKLELANHLAKLGLNIPDLAESQSLGTLSLQCAADVAELALDVGVTVGAGVSGIGLLPASVKAVSLIAQLYATGVSCDKALGSGIHAVSKLSEEAVKQLSRISGRMSTHINKYIESASTEIASSFSPSKLSFASMPKPAWEKLQSGLLRYMAVAEKSENPVEHLLALIKNKLEADDGEDLGRAIVILNRGAPYDAKLSEVDDRDAKRAGKDYEGLNLATAFGKFFENTGFQSLVTKL